MTKESSPSPAVATPADEWSAEQLTRSLRFDSDYIPIVVTAAAPLINLAHVLRHTEREQNPDKLRCAAIDLITDYERSLIAAHIRPEQRQAAHYVVCATLDDVVLSKPWGVQAGWAQTGLTSTFHMDVNGGDRVFELLHSFQQTPLVNKDILLLFYLCLSLAFEGRMRVATHGVSELSHIRNDLYKTLRGQYGIFVRELSPHWHGVSAQHTPSRIMPHLRTILLLMAFTLTPAYLFFTFSLNRASQGLYQRFASLPSQGSASIIRSKPKPRQLALPLPHTPPPKPEVVAPRVPKPDPLANLFVLMQPEVESGLVNLTNAKGSLLIRINNAGLFRAGKAEVSPDFRGLLQRIGSAMAADKFHVLLSGYTDNIPIHTTQFSSNRQLSLARAQAVGEILAPFIGSDAILTEGRADSNPLADNASPEGREMNRRIEIRVLTEPDKEVDADVVAKEKRLKLPANPPLPAIRKGG